MQAVLAVPLQLSGQVILVLHSTAQHSMLKHSRRKPGWEVFTGQHADQWKPFLKAIIAMQAILAQVLASKNNTDPCR